MLIIFITNETKTENIIEKIRIFIQLRESLPLLKNAEKWTKK